MASIPIALELFSVRKPLANDAPATLKAVADMGYAGVEFAGPPQHGGEEIRDMLQETNLVCCGWHTPFALVQEDTLAATIELNRTIGNRYIIVPGIPADLRKTRDDWLALARFFNDLSAKLADVGMVTGYHNHNVEFKPLDGECPWDTFFGNTVQEVVMQLDMGNALSGGADLMQILRKYPGRCQTVHLKPYTRAAEGTPQGGFAPLIGDDDVPWEEVFEFCETHGRAEWYIVEYEVDAEQPFPGVSGCLDRLREMGK